MDITRGTPHLLPGLYAMPHWNLLFPERGEAVPFTVTTTGVEVAGREALITQRVFTFESLTRRFDSLTIYDDDSDRLFDFLRHGGHIVSELHRRVNSGELVIEGGKQWARVAGARSLDLSSERHWPRGVGNLQPAPSRNRSR
jgi:hypothetical protein